MTTRRLIALLAVLSAACTGVEPPPDTRVETVVDTMHGVAVPDPYRWLENQDAPETRSWIAEQNAYTDRIVAPSPLRSWIARRYRELADRDDVGGVRTAGPWQYFALRRAGEELSVVYRRPASDSVAGEPTADTGYEAILDPADFDPSYRTLVSLMDISADTLLMYSLRIGGSDELEIRFRDSETLEDLPDRLPRALYGGVRFVDDGAAVQYTHRSRVDGPRIKKHVFGTPLSSDVTIWGEAYGPETFIGSQTVADGRWRIYTAQHGWASNDIFIQEGAGPIRPVVEGVPAHFDEQFHDGSLWLVTDWLASNARLVRVDPARPDTAAWEEVLPEDDLALADVRFIEDRIYARYIDDVAHRVRVFDMDGTPVEEIEVPPYSNVSVRDAEGDETVTLAVGGYLRPGTEYELDLESEERTETEPSEVPWDGSAFEVSQRWFTSADGTRGPMYVLHRRGIELDGSHPTILTGYGGFDVANMPGFSTTAALWLEMGGVWAVATLRGGSEYGEAWHRGGMLENKQHVFDDFIAASERLIELGFTRPDRLGIWGSSNGGLLVASAMTQRPELYAAVYCGYPDLDMLRFWSFVESNNMPALLEYGDARNRSHFEAMLTYSPYQAVEDGVDYPAVLLTTGDYDTRVPPLQARKMTARLQAATRSGRPVALWYDAFGGHAASRGRPMSLRVEDTARELAFMAEWLGMDTEVAPGG